MDTPLFLFENENTKAFATKTKRDIDATLDFLYKRGMWSKFHYDEWKKQLKTMDDPEKLHLWWDAITAGAMFEIESPLEERIESLGEIEKGECPSKKKKQQQKNKNLEF